jgi:hypothetical protein
LGCIYRPPDKKTDPGRDKQIHDIIRRTGVLVEQKKINGIILAGDFNYRDIKWKYSENRDRIEPTNDASKNEFVKAINDSNLYQNIHFKTFIETLNNDTLDLVFTDKKVSDKQDKILGDKLLSMHIGICWKYEIQPHMIERESDAEFLDRYQPWLNNNTNRYEKFNTFYKKYNTICQFVEGVCKDFGELPSCPKFKPEKINGERYWFDDRLYCLQEKQPGQPTYKCRFKSCKASFCLENGNDINESTHNREHKDGCKKRSKEKEGLENKECTYFEL